MAQTPPRRNPRRTCRDSTPSQYTLKHEQLDLVLLSTQSQNAHYNHRLLHGEQSWRDYLNIFPSSKREIYTKRCEGVVYSEQTAKWFLWSKPCEYTDQYVKYAPISAKITKPAWKYLSNHIIAITRLFYYQDDWYFYLCKVKKTIAKYDEDYHNVEIIRVKFIIVPELHLVAKLLHDLHVTIWDQLPVNLKDFLSTRSRLSNSIVVQEINIRLGETLVLLQDGSLHCIQCFNPHLYHWNDKINNIRKFGLLQVWNESDLEHYSEITGNQDDQTLPDDKSKEEKDIGPDDRKDDMKDIEHLLKQQPNMVMAFHVGLEWIRHLKINRKAKLDSGYPAYQIRYVSMTEIRHFANITHDHDRLINLKCDLDKKPSRASSDWDRWVKKGINIQIGYIWDCVWDRTKSLGINVQSGTRNKKITSRIGHEIDIMSCLQHEIRNNIKDEIWKTLYYGSSFNTADNSRKIPISLTDWMFGAPLVFEDLNIDISQWQQQVNTGHKISIYLIWNQIQMLRDGLEDFFYLRFRAPKLLVEQMGGLFAHYDDNWKTKYCDGRVLMENSCLNIPSDCMVTHLVYLECPTTERLNHRSAWNIRVQCVNAEYRVMDYTFEPNFADEDFNLRTTWRRRLNIEETAYVQFIEPYLSLILTHLNDMMDKHWKKHLNKSDRLIAVQKHLKLANIEQVTSLLQSNDHSPQLQQIPALLQPLLPPLLEPLPPHLRSRTCKKSSKKIIPPCPDLEPISE